MKKTCAFRTATVTLFMILISGLSSLQAKSDTLDAVSFTYEQNTLTLFSEDSSVVSVKKFNEGELSYYDLNDDGVEEFVIVDKKQNGEYDDYTMYVYAADSLIYLVDSISSGISEPYADFNEELGGVLIYAGSPGLDSLMTATDQDSLFLPLSLYNYDGYEIKNINDDIYSSYLTYNKEILKYLEPHPADSLDCGQMMRHRSAIITIYYYYRKAGELTLANQFLHGWYSCPDLADIQKYLEHF